MSRKTFIVVLGLVIVGAGILGYHQIAHAFSCKVYDPKTKTWVPASTCGYFTSAGNGSAWYDVLAQPALVNVTNAANFESTMSSYLSSGSTQNSMGAAFLIDNMLNYKGVVADTVGGGVNAGKSYAQNSANFNKWKALINSYAVNSCSINSESNCPGKSFGINWQYKPTQAHFCSGRTDSGYDNNGWPNYTGVNDDILYKTPANGTSGCNYEYLNSMPEIHIYWPGGQFNIGKHCGNLQDITNVIPQSNTAPEGSISVTCVDPNTGLQSAHVTFRDMDAATSAHFTVGAQNYGTYTSSGAGAWFTQDIPLLLPPTTDAYNKQTVTLYVKDTGPLGDQAYHSMPVMQTDSPCVNFGCTGTSTTPTIVDPYMTYSLKVGVRASVGQSPSNPTIDIQSIVTPSGVTYYTHGQIAAANNAGVVEATFTNVPKTNGTGQFTANWRLYSNGTLLTQCSGKFNVINLPYLNVYGGDVMTGAAPAASGACSINNAAGAYSWNQYGAGYAGAGSEYAVQALAQIEEFGSGMNPSSSNPPTDLSFANSAIAAGKVNPSQGLFGGFFGDSSGAWACSTDYTKGLGSPISGAAATAQIAALPGSLANGTQTRIYANGDVYISRKIAYNTSGWGGVTQIPLFELVVTGGNIYVDSSVTQLDGIYVAEPSGAVGGKIIDCATNGGGIWKQVDPTVNGFYSTCNKQLVINGAFVAKQVLFGRTNGSLGQAAVGDSLGANHDAEVFNYTPEIWLPRSATTPSDTYDAITALPPVL